MKKAGSSSKDRLAKSGNTRKRSSSAGGQDRPTIGLPVGGVNQAAANPPTDEPQDPPVVVWPEWSDAEIAAEKWAAKHAFEDPEGLGWLPRSLRGSVDAYKRPAELAPEGTTPICIQALHLEDDVFHSAASSTPGSMGFNFGALTPGLSHNVTKPSTAHDTHAGVGGLGTPTVETPDSLNAGERTEGDADPSPVDPAIANDSAHKTGGSGDAHHKSEHGSKPHPPQNILDEEAVTHKLVGGTGDDESVADHELQALSGTSKLFQTNRHLLPSELMRTILCNLHFLYDQIKQSRASGGPGAASVPDEYAPWDHIYPKTKDGLPMYNVSGKYAVKLFWLGAWRKVTVDDRIPVDSEGRVLLISTPVAHEIWPMLLTKAILKVVSTSYKDGESTCEFGEVDIFHTLKGWLPEKLALEGKPFNSVWTLISGLNLKSLQTGSVYLGPNQRASFAPVPTAASQKAGQAAPAGDRSNMPSAQGGRAVPGAPAATVGGGKINAHVIVLAWREVEEVTDKVDMHNMSGPFGVIDIRELPGIIPQRLMKLRSYFSCGFRTKKLTEGKPGSKIVDESADASADATDLWIPYQDFLRTFRAIVVYHSPSSFKLMKTINNIPDPSKPSDTLRTPQLLYLSDTTKELPVHIYFATYGRVKGEQLAQVSCVLVEEYDWTGGTASKKPFALKMSTNAALMSFFRIPAGRQAYKFIVNCPTAYSLSVYARDGEFLLEDEGKYMTERLDLHVKDIDDGFAAQPANSWFLFVKNVIRFSQPTFLAAYIYVPEYVQSQTCLRAVDNDTGEEVPLVFYLLRPQIYHPNKNGYTFVAECRTLTPKPAGKWKLRYVSEAVPILGPEKPLELWIKPIVQDFDDVFTPNKYNLLFRYVVKVKDAPTNCVSLQLSFAFPTVWVKLQVFDNGVEMHSARGKGVATIPVLNLVQTEEQIVAPAPTKETKGSDKKGKDGGKDAKKEEKEKEKEKIDPALADAAAGDVPPAPKHRYIIQGTIEATDLAKLIGTSSTPAPTESNRPPSRGPKPAPPPASSAKKKRSATISGPSAVPAIGSLTGSAALGRDVGIGGGSAGGSSADDRQTYSELVWRLRLISTDTASLVVARDTEKEDRFRAVKDSWEAAQQGRAARAREARDSYLKQVEAGTVRPVVITGVGGENVPYKPWTIHGTRAASRLAVRPRESKFGSSVSMARPSIDNLTSIHSNEGTPPRLPGTSRPPSAPPSRPGTALTRPPRVLSQEEKAAREEERQMQHREHEQYQDTVRKLRAQDREKRSHMRQMYLDKLEEKFKQIDALKETDLSRREVYRQKALREFQELQAKAVAAMEAAARESALAAESSAEAEIAQGVAADKGQPKKKGTGKR
ncbi:uncharacterized protein EV422DRAFT_619596 [Fimicolochytrium jonesii]|uniref:uncharacterized protein n=1 Tax=Fimicolochytrium jonesii TaxID=1396493 RepID=UPI0022FEE54C|nr:uncharacterized protein EV422DRAFT_619596 [Fimicolochytrium jonesii]KAI8821854.1 hypothetical protein EV422DRAFT_619596 [Fimicolochytrium jonesii]